MVDGGSNGNDTQAYLKVLTLGSAHAKIHLGITICRFIELSNPTINKNPLIKLAAPLAKASPMYPLMNLETPLKKETSDKTDSTFYYSLTHVLINEIRNPS